MIANLTEEEVRLSEAQFRAAEAVIAAFSPRSDQLTAAEKEAYDAALQYVFVCLDNAPCVIDDRIAKGEET